MHTIFQQLVYAREKDKDTVLATIIWDDGSAPRGRGSQMLVDGSGLLAGTIGGGAVEGRSIEIAREMLQSGRKGYTHFFRLRKDGEVGMVCGGDVTVYFCRILAGDAAWGAVAVEVLQRVKDRVPGYLTLPLDGSPAAITDTDESDGPVFRGASGGGAGADLRRGPHRQGSRAAAAHRGLPGRGV